MTIFTITNYFLLVNVVNMIYKHFLMIYPWYLLCIYIYIYNGSMAPNPWPHTWGSSPAGWLPRAARSSAHKTPYLVEARRWIQPSMEICIYIYACMYIYLCIYVYIYCG